MYIANNRFRIAAGREKDFERVWTRRRSYLDAVPGFLRFRLLRGARRGKETLFISHSEWSSRRAFTAWTESEAFAKAHGRARTPQGVLLGHPEFEGYRVVETRERGAGERFSVSAQGMQGGRRVAGQENMPRPTTQGPRSGTTR